MRRRELSTPAILAGVLERSDTNKWVTIKSFAIIPNFGVQPEAPVEFE
jgi:hypothetical protein